MVIKDGKSYYPLELEKILSSNGGIVYDRKIWSIKCKLCESRGYFIVDSSGATILLRRNGTGGETVYTSAYSGEEIDNFITEVLK